MIIDKYTLFKKCRVKLFEAVPALAEIDGPFTHYKLHRYKKRLLKRKQELELAKAATGKHPLFHMVEVETFNRCNGECAFCPVNKHVDPRTPLKMPEELFHSILNQLEELDYSGLFYLHSNNEPFLDQRIVSFIKTARARLPKATLGISTNGSCLTPDTYREVIDFLDAMTVNNYCSDFVLKDTHRQIQAVAATNPEWDRKTQIVIRYINESMTSRGGNAPNRHGQSRRMTGIGCSLPTRQIVIRPTGKMSLCCNDATGLTEYGDCSRERLVDIWYGARYDEVRRRILESRSFLEICRHCDTIQGAL